MLHKEASERCVKRGVVVRVRIKRGNGMNDRVDKSGGIVTLAVFGCFWCYDLNGNNWVEVLANINPIEPLRLVKQATRIKRN